MDKFEEYKAQIQAEHSDYKTLFVSKETLVEFLGYPEIANMINGFIEVIGIVEDGEERS